MSDQGLVRRRPSRFSPRYSKLGRPNSSTPSPTIRARSVWVAATATPESPLNTRVGRLVLSVARLRSGEFSTRLFCLYRRTEQVLLAPMDELVVNAVYTPKVRWVVEEWLKHQ